VFAADIKVFVMLVNAMHTKTPQWSSLVHREYFDAMLSIKVGRYNPTFNPWQALPVNSTVRGLKFNGKI